MRSTPWLKLSVGFGIVLGIAGGVSAGSAQQAAGPDERLARLLERTGEYCAKLERAALDFTCIEKIEEKTYSFTESQPDVGVAVGATMSYAYRSLGRAYTNNYVYDYQFVRKAGQKKEQRILVEENGRKKKEENAELTTLTVRVENALFGPIGLLGAQWQESFDYAIKGEESQKGKKLVVVEARPKPTLEGTHCYGRVWIQEDDGSIAKIAWDQTSVGNFARIQATARELGAEPRLTSVTEYGLAKNGLRFPSKDITEEAYQLKNGKKYIKAVTTIVYKDYKFFTVETEIVY